MPAIEGKAECSTQPEEGDGRVNWTQLSFNTSMSMLWLMLSKCDFPLTPLRECSTYEFCGVGFSVQTESNSEVKTVALQSPEININVQNASK